MSKEHRDRTGKFTHNNPGRRKGVKNKKTEMWDQLGEFLVNEGADVYLKNLEEMMSSEDEKQRLSGMTMYKDTLEFFKPRLSRVDQNNTGNQSLEINISYEDKPENTDVSASGTGE